MSQAKTEKPLVYSCSGCSNVAQLANDIALWLRDRDVAEMSCIAGVGGDVKPLVRVAQSGRPILALDGCPLNCVKQCLKRQGVEPTWHIQLSDLGIKKRDGVSCTLEEMYRSLEHTHKVLGLEPTFDYKEQPGLACNDSC
ncbi:zinc-binding protein [Aliidiomarina taiwanensis]|uniref:Zinc-binding protein n=1 Tax=Aliidiomarina taiwanensis TaxID=946228 RepID=A0A432X7B9_9GAMM|nr:putative zinc-binding protein [Aliidiomarina taiwanensis]RUO42753.1 zinc-binding protein [Aliidiomarina taiwanensis]